MATLLLSTLGTAIGGPLGGAAGAILGGQLDHSLAGRSGRQGPRLRDLAASTSAYGQPVPRHFGRVRAPGTIIWATDLTEQRETQGGGKGQPSVTSYSYAVSFAVALASRPIAGLGRIWADGQLLRGAAGDLKVGGVLRLYNGHGDQQPDPLIAADAGPACPAFRGIAYCVFEGLQLASFGNRIPALTFEILADDEGARLSDLIEPAGAGVHSAMPLPGLSGWSDDGGSLAAQLGEIDALYPLSFRHDDAGIGIGIIGCGQSDGAIMLPEAAAGDLEDDGGSAPLPGASRAMMAGVPAGIRYYDVARDYQIGTQLTGNHGAGFSLLDFAGTTSPETARLLARRLRQRAEAEAVTAVWRMVELDPRIVPGAIVRLPDRGSNWRVESWELDAQGVVVELARLPAVDAGEMPADAGAALPQIDLPSGPTIVAAVELPPAGPGGQGRQIHAAVSSEAAGWTGAALYQELDGNLVPVGLAAARRSTVGRITTILPPSPGVLLERGSTVEVSIPADLVLESVGTEQLAAGANRAMIGAEIVQFAMAEPLRDGHWRLTGLLRGRGGTEPAAKPGHAAGEAFVLLDDTLTPVAMDRVMASTGVRLAAIGLADAEPVLAEVANAGASIQPLAPVHVRRSEMNDGAIRFRWTERIGGAWSWPDMPAASPLSRWQVGVGPAEAPAGGWFVDGTTFDLPAAQLRDLRTRHAGEELWLRQIMGEVTSSPVALMTL